MDLYVILGIERGATLADIKRAYKRLARKFHPDINPGDRMAAAQFRQIAEAYETLIDPDRRRRYDTSGAAADAGGSRDLRLRGVRFLDQRARHGRRRPSAICSRTCFQRETQRGDGTPERGVDLHQTITIEFDDALAGGQRVITVTRQEHCATCQGSGRLQRRRDAVPALPWHRGGEVGARPHGVLEAVRLLRRLGAARADALPGVQRPADRDARGVDDDQPAAGAGGRLAYPRSRQGTRRPLRPRRRRWLEGPAPGYRRGSAFRN